MLYLLSLGLVVLQDCTVDVFEQVKTLIVVLKLDLEAEQVVFTLLLRCYLCQ